MKISNLKFQISNFVWLGVWIVAALVLAAGIHPLYERESIAGSDERRSIAGFNALAGGVLAGRDTLSHDYPAAWWGWSQVRDTGNIPLWNPSWFCGQAFIASQTFMPFYPPNWLGALLPFPLAFNIQYPIHLLLAAMVMAWACRARGLGWIAAGLAGLSWGFGSHLATLAGPGHIQKLQALAWLPLVTTGAWRIGRGDARRGFLPLGAGLALQVTAGHLQILYLTLVVAVPGALAGFRGTATLRARGRRGYVPVDFRLAVGALALLTALGLSAVFWMPTAEFAALSNREGRLSWEDATRGSLPPEEAFEFALPRLRGDSMPLGRGAELANQPYNTQLYIGRYGESSTSAPERVVSDYVGAGVLVFALYALFARRRGRRTAWAYAALAAAALTLSMGRYLPMIKLPWIGERSLYSMALNIIPGLSHFRSPSTMMALLAYSLTMAAALGVQGFLHPHHIDPARRQRAWRRGGMVMLACALVAIALALVAAYHRDLMSYQIRHTKPDSENIDALAQVYLRLFPTAALSHTLRGCGLVLGLAGLWALIASLGRRRIAGGIILAALTAAWGWDLLANIRPFWNAADAAPFEQFLTRHWAMPKWAGSDEPVVRYLEVGRELSNRALTLSRFGPPAYLSVGSASGYHPVTYGKYEALQRRLGFLHPNFLRMFGVKYLLWPVGDTRPWPEGFKEYQRNEAAGQILLYNPEIRYVREVEQIVPQRDFASILERLAKPGFNVYDSDAMLRDDMPKDLRDKVLTFGPPTNAQTSVFALGPGETRIRTTMRIDGRLAVAEPAVPGWRFRVDGVRARQIPAALDGFTLLIGIDGGRHDVLLYYDPASQRFGLFLTALTLAFVAFLAGRRAGWRMMGARRQPATR